MDRARSIGNDAGQLLLSTAYRKQSFLCVSLDLPTAELVVHALKALHPVICAAKLHADALPDLTHDHLEDIQRIAREHHVVLIEDRKFSDIGHTVRAQYCNGPHRIITWAHLVTVHSIAGLDAVNALCAAADEYTHAVVGTPSPRGCLLVAELSCHGNLISPEYTQTTLDMLVDTQGHRHPFVAGFIASKRLALPAGVDAVFMTPGVHLQSSGDAHGQQYRDVDQVMHAGASDIIIVGRGVLGSFAQDLDAAQLVQRAVEYKNQAWNAFLRRNASTASTC